MVVYKKNKCLKSRICRYDTKKIYNIFFEKLSVSCQGVPKKWIGFHAYSQDAVHRGLKILETPSLAMKERALGIFFRV